MQWPDGFTTLFSYGATNGRLDSVTFSRGTLGYGYDTVGRVSTLTDPGGVNLAFTYDGSLPLSESWSGNVTGAVSRTFTTNFELATETVNGAHAVAFCYDTDRLLTSAGALTVTRHPEHGLVTSTTLGTTTETHEYSEFGEPSRQTSTQLLKQMPKELDESKSAAGGRNVSHSLELWYLSERPRVQVA